MMNSSAIQKDSLKAFKAVLESYCAISTETWEKLSTISVLKDLKKGEFFTEAGQIPEAIGFVYSGLLRTYVTDWNGNEYNKIFFQENTLPASIVALLTNSPSKFSIECLEDTILLELNFKKYRNLLNSQHDLKWFQILYLEKNWVIEKEEREVALVQENATERYLKFLKKYSALEKRISQFHIASHLGITPTQLSRIRKSLANAKK